MQLLQGETSFLFPTRHPTAFDLKPGSRKNHADLPRTASLFALIQGKKTGNMKDKWKEWTTFVCLLHKQRAIQVRRMLLFRQM